MKAVVIEEYGEAEVLKVQNSISYPKVEKNQVLIENYAAGINPHDLYLRKGILEPILDYGLPLIPGLDIAGKVVKIGEAVTDFSLGQNVYGMMDANANFSKSGFAKTGAYAEYCVTRADTLSPIPHKLSFIEAASIPLVTLTAYQAIVKKVKAKENQRILINGASGGVGCAAMQISQYIGLDMTVVCSESSNSFVESFCPSNIINYEHSDFTGTKEKYDIIFDVVGNKDYVTCRTNLTKTGVYISNVPSSQTFDAFQNPGEEEKYGFNENNKYNWVIPSGKDLMEITRMIDEGHIKAKINRVFDIENVREAHEFTESSIPKGKNVLSIKE
ncbi:MAG: NADP-dependent oxidoreductase [Bacteroidota bacterium]